MKASARDRTATDSASTSEPGVVESADVAPPGVAALALGGLSLGGLSLGGLSFGPAVRRAAAEHASDDPLGGAAIPQTVLGALSRNRGRGQPLPSDLSAGASEALGQDLSPVRVHTGPEAATLARSVQSVAFTHGHDIYFSAGAYRPTEAAGQRLIAHELGHVGQPESGAGGTIGRADDPAEAAADRAATGVLAALRRQAARGAAPSVDHDAHSEHSAHPHGAHRHEVRRQPLPGNQLRRMKLNKDGTYAMLSGFRNTADREGFAAWVQQLQDAGNTVILQNLRTALHRRVLDPDDHETIAMSLVQRALDKLAPAAVAPVGDAPPGLQNLPRADWWKLFIEAQEHDGDQPPDENAMRFDNQKSPGYYAAMSRAFETFVANSDNHELSFADYDAMHLAVTRDTLAKKNDGTFKPVPHKLSAQDITYPMTKGEFPHPDALKELRDQRMLGLDADKQRAFAGVEVTADRIAEGVEFDDDVADKHEDGVAVSTVGKGGDMVLTLRQIYQGQGPVTDFSSTLQLVKVTSTDTIQLQVNTNRQSSAANAEVTRLFKSYYAGLKEVAASEGTERQKRRKKLGQICRLVRALHVGHYFHDANGRLNTMVLLNRLLLDCGFTPVVIDRTDIFGGGFAEIELVRAIEAGFKKFAREVGLAHPKLDEPVDAPLEEALGEPRHEEALGEPRHDRALGEPLQAESLVSSSRVEVGV